MSKTIFQSVVDANNDIAQAQAQVNEAKQEKAAAEEILTSGRALLAAVDAVEADPNVQASFANNAATQAAFATVAEGVRAIKPDIDALDATLQGLSF